MTEQPTAFHILALETSCDETAAAVVRNGTTIVSNVVASQMEMHERYGGVVPEVASRQHILSLLPVLHEAVAALPDGWNDIHAIAATYGPGLSGALITGLNAAKAIAWQRQLLFVGVNHLEAHIYANWLQTEEQASPPQFPLVALVVSGGHTLLALLRDHGDYQLLGQTRDDAAGEAFDKVARILGLGYPGGPAIEQTARPSVGNKMTFPRAWLRDTYDFSFSGLKTAVLHKVQERQGQRETPDTAAPAEGQKRTRRGRKSPPADPAESSPVAQSPRPTSTPDGNTTAHMAHAFQESVVDVLVSKTVQAAAEYGAAEILLAGGVSANMRLREAMNQRAEVPVRCPPIWLCTDNAAMVAAAAYYRFHEGLQSGWDLDVLPNLKLGQTG